MVPSEILVAGKLQLSFRACLQDITAGSAGILEFWGRDHPQEMDGHLLLTTAGSLPTQSLSRAEVGGKSGL